jgi:hypothetical protein
MGLLWANPVALWGLSLLAVPVLIHLLLRPQIMRMRFPSLRFLPASRLASARRRIIHDWPLLLVRLAILACAVAALAGPILVTPSREESWSARIARAIVVDAGQGGGPSSLSVEQVVEREHAGAATSTRIDAKQLNDGLMQAAAWLGTAPPAAREIAVVSAFQEGSVTPRDVAALPADIGVRFVLVPPSTAPAPDVRVLTFEDGTPVEATHALRLGSEPLLSAAVTREPVDLLLRIEASADEHRLLEAAVQAVLAEGLFIEGDAVPVVLVWTSEASDGAPDVSAPSAPEVRDALDRLIATVGSSHSAGSTADEAPWVPVWLGRLAAAQQDGGLFIMGRGGLDVDDALRVARGAMRAMYAAPDLERYEPRVIDGGVLDTWTRAAAPADLAAVAAASDSDARWMWALVLILMALEQWMRRARPAVAAPMPATEPEVRVA